MDKEKFVKECGLLLLQVYANGQSTEDMFRKIYDNHVFPQMGREQVYGLILKKLLVRKESLKLDLSLTDREKELIDLHIGSLYEDILKLVSSYENT